MSTPLSVPILNDLAPSGFRFGHAYLVEFDPHSLWYESSFSVAAASIRQGIRTEYHTFMRPVSEVHEALARLGLNVEESKKKGLLRVYDTFTKSLGLPDPEKPSEEAAPYQTKSFNLHQWNEAMAKETTEGVPNVDKKWLHVDDNTSIFMQSHDEKEIVQSWRTRFIPWARVRELVLIISVVRGVASETFYNQSESIFDGIFDFISREEEGEIAHYARVRTMHGMPIDTRWRTIKQQENGGVKLMSNPMKSEELGIKGWLKGSKIGRK